MPLQRKWNKFAIAAAVVLAVAFFGQSLIGSIILPTATAIVIWLNAISPVAAFFFGWVVNWLLFLVSFFLSLKAVLSIDNNTEKGRPLAWVVLGVAGLILLVAVATNIMKAKSLSDLTGKSFTQIVNEGGAVEIASSKARDEYKVSNAIRLQTFLREYQTSDHKYPLNQSEIESAWTNPNKIDWEVITYLYVDSTKSYVIRTKLEADYLGNLNKYGDRDGMQESLDCSDEQMYFCLTP